MAWTCSKCGRTINAPPGRQVFCSCGSVKDYPIEAFKAAGRKVWAKLHQYAQDGPWNASEAERWFWSDWFAKDVPGYGCNCQRDAKEILERRPIIFSSPEEFFASGVEFHNAVNAKLERAQVGLDEAIRLWNPP